MPIRPIRIIEEFDEVSYNNKTYKIPKGSLESTRDLVSEVDDFNEILSNYESQIAEELEANDINKPFEIRPFKYLTEGVGKEFIKPRNYLSREVFVLGNIKIYLGEFNSLLEFKSNLIDTIVKKENEQRAPKEERRTFVMPKGKTEEVGKGGKTDDESLNYIRSYFRRRQS